MVNIHLESEVMTRKTNNEKIIEYLEEIINPISTTDLANAVEIDIKNISRYLKELEQEEKIDREVKQIGKLRFVNISLKQKKEKTSLGSIKKQIIHEKESLTTSRKVEKRDTTHKKIIRSTGDIHTIERNQERLFDIYFKTDTIENLSKKYGIPNDYLLRLEKNFRLLKYPPRIQNNTLVCYQCGKSKDKRLVFHHNHQTRELIALICDSCNQKLENNESTINQRSSSDTTSKTSVKTIKENRKPQNVVFLEQMSHEVKIFGRTIPINKVREIARKTLEYSRNMIKGIKTYQSAWESRYKRYLEEKPNNFLIDEFESMQKTLDFLKEMNELNEKLKNREGVD